MPDMNVSTETTKPTKTAGEQVANTSVVLPVWETPTMDDVSEQVMAQPYIRFT